MNSASMITNWKNSIMFRHLGTRKRWWSSHPASYGSYTNTWASSNSIADSWVFVLPLLVPARPPEADALDGRREVLDIGEKAESPLALFSGAGLLECTDDARLLAVRDLSRVRSETYESEMSERVEKGMYIR